jgi:hypothetical protein
MKLHRPQVLRALVLALLATVASAAPAGTAMLRTSRTTTQADELRARFDPRLEQMRAGQVAESTGLTGDERAALRAAQDRSADLLDMRAGSAGGVLLVLAVVLLIILLL